MNRLYANIYPIVPMLDLPLLWLLKILDIF